MIEVVVKTGATSRTKLQSSSQIITTNQHPIFSLQCFDTVVGRQEGHPACKIGCVDYLIESYLNNVGF